MNDELSPEDEAMLARAFSRFKCRLMMHRIGIPLKPVDGPTDEEYRRALESPPDDDVTG